MLLVTLDVVLVGVLGVVFLPIFDFDRISKGLEPDMRLCRGPVSRSPDPVPGLSEGGPDPAQGRGICGGTPGKAPVIGEGEAPDLEGTAVGPGRGGAAGSARMLGLSMISSGRGEKPLSSSMRVLLVWMEKLAEEGRVVGVEEKESYERLLAA